MADPKKKKERKIRVLLQVFRVVKNYFIFVQLTYYRFLLKSPAKISSGQYIFVYILFIIMSLDNIWKECPETIVTIIH